MNWIDLLRMSSNNLKRRKLRTFLTVLGVVIGTTSIVVMISLGLGMQKSLYDEVGQSGGLTSISVTGAQVGDSMISYASDGDSQDSNKYIDDNLVKQLGELEHVKSAYPQYEMTGILLKGKYEQYVSIEAMPHDALEALGIKMTDGGDLDEKIIAIPVKDPTYNTYYDIHELPAHIFDEMMHFFEVYKSLEHKQTTVKEICHRDEAVEIIKKCVEIYEKTYKNGKKRK